MILPVKMHAGALGHGLISNIINVFLQVSYQCQGLHSSPYNVRLRRRYILSGVRGQPWGGLMTYFSSSGRNDCMKACETSPDLGICFIVAAMEMRRQRFNGEMTGAKQLLLLQLCGSRFS